MAQRRDAAIVGIYEYPLRVAPGVSALQIKAESAATALADAGLSWQDVDAVYDTGGDQSIGGLGIAEYLASSLASSTPLMSVGVPSSFRPIMP